MENEESFDKNNKIGKFKEKYIKMVNTFKYEEEAEEFAYLEDCIDELSVYEMREKSILRTEGGSFVFSLRISKELDILGIENYLVEEEKEDKKYWCNLYKCDGVWYIADLTADILNKYYADQNNRLVKMEPEYDNMYAIDFFLWRTGYKTLEEIKDDGKKIEELKRYSIEFGDIVDNTINQDEVKSVEVRKKITFETILQKFKTIIEKIKQDKEEGKGILVKIEKFSKDVLNKIKDIYESIKEEVKEEEVGKRNIFKDELKVEGISSEEIGEKTEISEIEKNIGDNTQENIEDNIEESIEENTERED